MFNINAKTVHVVSHTHWDREWYMPYERHHKLLVELFDTLTRVFAEDPGFKSFHLDGQTIPLEDYLEIRPEMRETVKELVREGKLIVGPWYVLQDEWLTSGEANIRNLLVGHAMAREFGGVCKVGYFPDSFGNMGQAPQLLEQAGMDTAVFGRGVKPVGFDNQVLGTYESSYSEMHWRSPNGSKVLGILFANWYNNGMEIPTDPDTAKVWWRDRIAAAERFASTPHLLIMNGCDHQPVQTDLSEALRVAREVCPDVEFRHSSFPEYIEAVKGSLPPDLSTIDGELRSQQTDGWWTLANTASARVYLKQMNQRCQALLERAAEPLAAIAWGLGRQEYPKHLLTYAWKTLMQNHPHDSICGCSVDEVHREMVTRFDKARRMAECIVEDSLNAIASGIDTQGLGEAAFAVFNTGNHPATGVVGIDLDMDRAYFGSHHEPMGGDPGEYRLVDGGGHTIPATIVDLGTGFGYDLPKDRFRQPYLARRFRVTFGADVVPPMGYRAYGLVRGGTATDTPTPVMAGDDRSMENRWLRVAINPDGTLDLLEKASGRTYRGLLAFEDTGDVGNEYIYMQPHGDTALTTRGLPAGIGLVERTAYRTVFRIEHDWRIPAEAEGLGDEIRRMVSIFSRKSRRSGNTVPMRITTEVALEAGSPVVKVRTTLDNTARDHRLRILFPTGIAAGTHRADSVLEVAERSNAPSAEWQNPSNCQHQQAFVNLSDGTGGLTIGNKGLNEYEVLKDDGTIAVTLLRCVGELGDWGVFPTPEAQCLGEHSFECSIVPHGGGDGLLDSIALAYGEQAPMPVVQTGIHGGNLPKELPFASFTGRGMALTCLKAAEDGKGFILRGFNTTPEPTTLCVGMDDSLAPKGMFVSNVLEEGDQIGDGIGSSPIPVDPAGIVTVRITR